MATVRPLAASSLLDAGCGEGETLERLGSDLPRRAVAVDISEAAVRFTAQRFPAVDVSRHSVDDLPFADSEFELVLCLEVLEHLPDPEAALAELARVSRGHIIISVPHEPWFQLGSLLRGKYLRGLGNHPEHVNRWSRRSLRALLEGQLDVVSLKGSFPWLIADCVLLRQDDLGRSRQPARSS